MANLIIYAANLSLTTYTMSLAENTLFPLANLSNYVAGSLWKSSALTAGQWLQCRSIYTYTADTYKDYILVDGANIGAIMDAGGRVRIQAAMDSGYTTQLTTHWDTDIDGGIYGIRALPITLTNKSYFRILYDNCGGLTPQIGNFFVGRAFDLGATYNFGYKDGAKRYEAVTESISLTGLIRTSSVYTGGRKVWKIAFKTGNALNAAKKIEWNTFYDKVNGRLRPFYLLDVDGVTYALVNCDFDDNPITAVAVGANEIPDIIFKAQTIT